MCSAEAQKPFVSGAANGAQANPLRHFQAHLRDAAARNRNGHAHLRRLDHHLAGQTARGVEHLVVAIDIVHGHPPRNGVNCVVASDVFDEHEHLRAFEQRAAMHGAR